MMIGILIPLLLLIPTPIKAEEVEVNPFYGPPLESEDPIIDWSPDQFHQWMDKMREWKAEQTRTDPEDSINKALLEFNNGSDDTAK
tara:strand:+ start:208 stop:465 length:258 start_codon:yes stop_codon:yes gene_type:complete